MKIIYKYICLACEKELSIKKIGELGSCPKCGSTMFKLIILQKRENIITCPYCTYLIYIMIKDELLDTSTLYFNQTLEAIPQFILRNKEKIKTFINAYEIGDPNLLKNE